MLIDAHQHVWDPARGDYGWLDPASPLCRRFAFADLEPLLDAAGVTGTILVQAAPTAAETDYLLAIARAERRVRGVVGWIDLAAPDAAAEIARRAADPLFVGVRPMLQDLPDPAWIAHAVSGDTIEAIAAHGLVFDALVRADQLDLVTTLARDHPTLRIVIDHAAKPPFGNPEAMAAWRAAIANAADQPNIACKLSGLLTEIPTGADPDTLRPTIRLLLDLFGADRLIWGSDWPVLTLAGSYAGWLGLAREALADLPPVDRAAIFGGNARRLYRLADRHTQDHPHEAP